MTQHRSPNNAWQAVREFAADHETLWARDPSTDVEHWGIHLNDLPPWNRLLGPVFDRGPASGLVMRAGIEQCRWGTPERADLTFSIAKTYLAILAGVASDQGLLRNPQEAVSKSVPGIGFDDPHNAQITWQQLLQQTSEWRGEIFEIPDQVDHYRRLSFEPPLPDPKAWPVKGTLRPPSTPGTYWEYNDVRINQLSLALAHLFGRSIPEVFNQFIAEPLDLSDTWKWHGYDNSWVTVAGKRIQSVPGGSHWGGGIQISAVDQARIAQMLLNQGKWRDQQILSSQWVDSMRVPVDIASFYGYLLWLNTDQKMFKQAPTDTYCAVGAGSSVVAHIPGEDVVVVTRWIQADAVDGLLGRIMTALKN